MAEIRPFAVLARHPHIEEYQLAGVPRRGPRLINTERADVIDEAVRATGQDDEARVVAAFCRTGKVALADAHIVRDELDGLGVLRPLNTAVTNGVDHGTVPRRTWGRFTQAYRSLGAAVASADTFATTPRGLIGEIDVDTGEVQVTHTDDFEDQLTNAAAVRKLAAKHGATHMAWQTELIWKGDESAPRDPMLRSTRQHVSLGRIVDGQFDPLLTLLDRNHPVMMDPAKPRAQ